MFGVFSLKVPESELELSTNIAQAWDDLFLESRRVDASLVSVKKKFTEVSNLHSVKLSLRWSYTS